MDKPAKIARELDALIGTNSERVIANAWHQLDTAQQTRCIEVNVASVLTHQPAALNDAQIARCYQQFPILTLDQVPERLSETQLQHAFRRHPDQIKLTCQIRPGGRFVRLLFARQETLPPAIREMVLQAVAKQI